MDSVSKLTEIAEGFVVSYRMRRDNRIHYNSFINFNKQYRFSWVAILIKALIGFRGLQS
jgi:hypothetical protein